MSGFTWAVCQCKDHYENRRIKRNKLLIINSISQESEAK